MLVIKLELWPKGNPHKARLLGVGSITNDQTGSEDVGNYVVRLLKSPEYTEKASTRALEQQVLFPISREMWRGGEVKGFLRSSRFYGPWDLLFRALRATVGQRNP